MSKKDTEDLLQFTIRKDGEYQRQLVEVIELKIKEIERLNNIINEFNEFIENVYNHINLGYESDEFMLIFDKWQELKGVDKE